MHVYIPRDTESSQEEVHCNIPVYPSAYIQNIVDNICVNAETWNAKQTYIILMNSQKVYIFLMIMEINATKLWTC